MKYALVQFTDDSIKHKDITAGDFVIATTGFTDEDLERGYIEVANRKGVIEQFPLTAISLGVVIISLLFPINT